jgi:hypothetical protein
MTRQKFIQVYGDKRIKDVSGILHNYLVDDMFEKHNDLERQIKIYSNEKVKDSIVYFDPILAFECE